MGGYVAFHTEKASEEDLDLQQPLTPEQNKSTFESKPKWQRALVMLAGPVANFILSIGILSLIFVNSVERQFIPEVSSISSEFLQNNSPLKQGDILTAINDKRVASLQDIRLELLSLSGTNGLINFTFKSGIRAFEYTIPVPVENYLSDPAKQNAPENYMGFDLSMKIQPTVGIIAKDAEVANSELMVNDLSLIHI